MKYTVYRVLLLFLFIGYSTVPLYVRADSFDELFDEDVIFSSSSVAATKALPTPQEVIVILQNLGFIDLLQEDFYLKTFDLNKRDLLDYPLFMFPWQHPDCTTMGYQIFLNQTGQMRFSSSCAKINAYLNVSGNGFAEKLQAILAQIENLNLVDFNVSPLVEVLALTEHFTVQERRLGVMFNYEQKVNDWHLWWYFPFYWRERNHFTSPEVQDALQAILDPIFGEASQDQQDAFASEHLISDQLGFGDFRFEFDRPVCCFPHSDVRVGFFVTIPTAFAVGKDLLGSNFQPPKVRPKLDLIIFFDQDPALKTVNQAQAGAFFLAALDNLSAMLLNTKLGNNGHFGIGFTFKTKNCLARFVPRPWAENIKLKSRMSIELQMPAIERRFFIQDNAKSQFAARNFDNENQATSNYNFLVQQLTDRLFPFYGQAVVFPGVIGRSTTRGIYQGHKWSFFIGTDTWIRSPERITEVLCPAACNIAVDKAQRKMGYQSKLMTGFGFHHYTDERDYTFSFNGDMTTLSAGLGDDFMLSFNIDVNF